MKDEALSNRQTITRILLIVALTLSMLFSAVSQEKRPQAYKLTELKVVNTLVFHATFDMFLNLLINNPEGQGYVFIYGSPRSIKHRSKVLSASHTLRGCGYAGCRITFVDVPAKTSKIELWFVPAEAEPPNPKP